MSEFLNDDFTAELRAYFLNQFLDEISQYVDLVDADSWSIYREEILTKAPDWLVDARTNEFVHFAEWFEALTCHVQAMEEYSGFVNGLNRLQAYLQLLTQEKKDEPDFPALFSFTEKSGRLDVYLHCHVGSQEVVLPVRFVVEIIGQRQLFPLPLPDPNLAGLIPYRGEAIPVFNLHVHGFASMAEQKTNYLVICDVQAERFAFEVSQADLLLEISSKELQSPVGAVTVAEFISHFVIRDNKNILVFDLEKLVAA